MSLARAIRSPSIVSRRARSSVRIPPPVPAPVAVAPPPAPPVPTAPPPEVEYWDFRYRTNRTTWDPGRSPAALLQWLERNPPRRRHVLIPGCGRGHEIFSFSGLSWNVTAIDLSPAAVEKARRRANRALAKQIHCGDFFAHSFTAPALFDVLYERTFLCALSPARRSDYAERAASLLKPGGLLVGFFYFDEQGIEPPYGLAPEEDRQLFAGQFTLVEEASVTDSLSLFDGRERWQVWQKR